MEFNEIRKIIEDDYIRIAPLSKSVGKKPIRESFREEVNALMILHRAVSPFILDTEQFINQIKYQEGKVSSLTFKKVRYYCKEKLGIEL